MIETRKSGRRRLIVATTLATVGVTLLAAVALAARPGTAPGAAPARGGACPGADQPAAELSTKDLRQAVRCLINAERTTRELERLTKAGSLQLVARRHSRVMARTECLAHECGKEEPLESRLAAAGYFEGAKLWEFAENTGCAISAEAMVASWTASEAHRGNLVDPRWGEVGVGAVHERVQGPCEKDFATFAVIVGWRQPAG